MSTDVYDIYSPMWPVLTSGHVENKKSNEWYTPAKYIEAAREVMGGIDLDPASCAFANETVKASRYYSKEDNGLSKPWYGRIWLNPPFAGTHLREVWTQRLLNEYQWGNIEQAILLMPVAVDTQWFQPLWIFPICFPTSRVSFYQEMVPRGNPNFGACFTYLGSNEQKFIDIFSQFGRITKAIDTPRQTVVPLPLWETH